MYLLWGLCASGMLVLALRGLLAMPPWLWTVARCLVVVQVVCLVVGVVLIAMGLSRWLREWVEGGVGRGGRWIRGLF